MYLIVKHLLTCLLLIYARTHLIMLHSAQDRMKSTQDIFAEMFRLFLLALYLFYLLADVGSYAENNNRQHILFAFDRGGGSNLNVCMC